MAGGFAGPYAGGPPAEALTIHRPGLTRFGLAELARVGVVGVVLAAHLLWAWLRWLLARVVGRLVRRRLTPAEPDASGTAVGSGGSGAAGSPEAAGGRRAETTHGGQTERGGSKAEALAEGAVDAFERLGPTFVKLGQLIASSPGLFPDTLSVAALRCLDDLPPFPAAAARKLIAERLGRPVDVLFAEFDDVPLSAASIAQVHACVLPDGREAVLKVRRPGIEGRMVTDLRIMYRIARLLDPRVELVRLMSLVGIIEQLYEVTCQELNFALEAHSQQRFGAAVGAFDDNAGVTVAEVYWNYCAPGLICMERFRGMPLDNPEALSNLGVDGKLPLRMGVKAWLEAAILHGPFHADAHAGNLWILDDGRLAFLDFGIMGELDQEWRDLLRDVLYTSMFDRDFERVARGLRRCGVLDPEVGTDAQLGWALGTMFGPVLDSPMSRMDSRRVIDMMLTTARRYSGANPPELTLFAKQLLYFERYSAALAPDWVLAADPYLLRNIFPAEVASRCAELGMQLPE